MSATLEADAFAAFFHNPSIIRVPGRRFPVQVLYYYYIIRSLLLYLWSVLTVRGTHPRPSFTTLSTASVAVLCTSCIHKSPRLIFQTTCVCVCVCVLPPSLPLSLSPLLGGVSVTVRAGHVYTRARA